MFIIDRAVGGEGMGWNCSRAAKATANLRTSTGRMTIWHLIVSRNSV